jgi:predicted DNA-binding transcriptional regulator AlpA
MRTSLSGEQPTGHRDFRIVFGSLEDCSLITADELASLLGMPSSTLYKRRLYGGLPAPISIGGRTLRWRVSDVRKWLIELPLTTPDARHRGEGVNHGGRPRKVLPNVREA